MRLLVIGGAGTLGTMTLPYLSEHHTVTVLDLKEPAPGPWVFRKADATSFAELASAVKDTDAVVYMAMGPVLGWGDPDNVGRHFDVSVKGLHLALWAAHRAGVTRAVFTSSMSVYGELSDQPYPDESAPPTATDFYGLSKRCGELVCEAAAREWGLSVVALRLCLPTADSEYPRQGSLGERTISTSARDTARAILAALEYGGAGFEAFTISGDHRQRLSVIAKAKRVLGWEPLDHSAE